MEGADPDSVPPDYGSLDVVTGVGVSEPTWRDRLAVGRGKRPG
jgi:hypothetical protein